jgi:nucleoside-diphosphate-sugar epimerase
MKNILITGGSGFLGTNLIKRLVTEPDTNIIAIDNFLYWLNIPTLSGEYYILADMYFP